MSKLPEVGKRYKYKQKDVGTFLITEIIEGYVGYRIEESGFESWANSATFFENFEELPEDNNSQNPELSPKVKDEKKTIDEEIKNHVHGRASQISKDMREAIKEALNEEGGTTYNSMAEFDKEYGIQEKIKFFTNPVHGIKDDFKKSQSIWNSVGEPPKKIEHVFIKWDDGEILIGKYDPNKEEDGILGLWYNLSRKSPLDKNRFKHWVSLTDFINYVEDIDKRLARAEKEI